MEGTEEADTQAAEAQASETAAETEVPQTPADTTAAMTDAVDTADSTAGAAADTLEATADMAVEAGDAVETTAAVEASDAVEATAAVEASDAVEATAAVDESLTPVETADAPAADDSVETAAVADEAQAVPDDTAELSADVEAAVDDVDDGLAVAAVGEADLADAVAADADADADEEAVADVDLAPAAVDEPAAPVVPAKPAPRVYEGPEPTTMEELLNEQATEIRSLKHGDVVEGSVVRIDKDEILVDIGAKSEGVISNRELYGRNTESQPQLSIGDVVLVYVLQPESPEGHAVLSLRRAGLERKWRSMQEQLDAGVIIEAPGHRPQQGRPDRRLRHPWLRAHQPDRRLPAPTAERAAS